MTHSNEEFEKIERSKECLYGPKKLLLCGFSASAQKQFDTLMGLLGLSDIPRIWLSNAQKETTLREISGLPDGHGEGDDSELPRAIIVGGIQQNELHTLMNGCRQSGMQQTFWAVVTPTSENWTLSKLLTALAQEAEAMAKAKRKQKGQKR